MKERIIKAALKLFSQKGYHLTSVQEIANCAEISRSTLYANFTSKKDILSSIYHFYLDSLYERLDVNLPEGESNDDRMNNFKVILTNYLNVAFENEDFLIMQMNEQNINDPKLAKYITDKRNKIYRRWLDIVGYIGGENLNYCSLDMVVILNSLIEEYSTVAIFDRNTLAVEDLVNFICQIISCIYNGFARSDIEPILLEDYMPQEFTNENLDMKDQLKLKIEDLEVLIKNIRLSKDKYVEVYSSLKLIQKEISNPKADLIIIKGLLRNIKQIKDLQYIAEDCIELIQ
ncbi:TetR/AcrR family transcriptional regulator [Metasolibacillus meyeri]|uniref:TetR/AcrR family transcriptional regulator n=1 Tax=Metasolibacillus meyeri TaxID=1071052 RepID=UPI00187D51AF|nr:TetR/AcrR family transcriptional regulator [Metasolibacillus meyeri]